ncbi:MAG: DNA polymerase, partial [Shewanella sp.]
MKPFAYSQVTMADLPVIENAPHFLDTETDGFYGRIELFQMYHPDLDGVLYVRRPNPIDVIKYLKAIEKANGCYVFQNAHYDLTTMQEQGVKSFKPASIKCVEDTLMLARLAMPELDSHSLDNVMTVVLDFDPYLKHNLDKKVLQKSNWAAPALTKAQLDYACLDVFYLPQVYEAVKSAANTDSYLLDKYTLLYCLDFQWNGLPVDGDRLNQLYQKQMKFIADNPISINVNSYQQVRAFIKQDASDDLSLAKFAQLGCPNSSLIRKLKKAKKLLSFLDKFDSERIFGKFKPAAKSGRLTSDDQNLQQLPRASKEVFGAPPGKVLVYADYAQLELRTICAITACKLMTQLFRDGIDLHSYTADVLIESEQTVRARTNSESEFKAARKYNRQVTKTANFSFLYGGGVGMFIDILLKQTDIWLADSEASRLKRRWANLFTEITAWQGRGISRFNRGALGSTVLGRKYMAERVTDFLNIENQGTGAEVAKLALHYLHK